MHRQKAKARRVGLTPAGDYAMLRPAGAPLPLRSNLAGNGILGEVFILLLHILQR